MPQYELMYLLASSVADTDVPKIAEQIRKFIEDFGGTDIKENQLGKKKLAYPIKKTRNGYYVVVNFSMDSKNVNQLEARIRSQENTIIRHLLLNLDEHLERMEKDAIAQSKIHRKLPETQGEAVSDFAKATSDKPVAKAAPAPAVEEKEVEKTEKPEAPAKKLAESPILDLDQEELDKKIEEALSEDLTK